MQRALAQLNHMPLRLIPLVLILVLVFSIIGPGVAQADPGWYNSDWDYRKKITINSANVSANLSDFPVLINLATDSDLASDALSNGYDILFTAGDEVTKLQHEIESFNGTSGNLTAWVMIPSLSATVDTDIYMYYGNAGSGNSENATGVWDSNYKMVQHLEDSTSGTDNITDSTVNANHGTDYNTPTLGATGQIDGAIGFNGSDQYVDTGSSFQTTLRGGFTISFWIKPTDGQPAIAQTIMGSTNAADEDRLNIQVKPEGKPLIAYESNNNVARAMTNAVVLSNGQEDWHQIVVVADNTTGGVGGLKVYFDGSEQTLDATYNGDTSGVTFADWTSADEIFISAYDNNGTPGSHFAGIIDEVRISSSTRTADWITTSYNNQNNPAAFITLGPEIGTPSVTTNTASSVEETSALLRGTLDDDGGEASEYRFQYGTTSGVYTLSTAWTGSINSGASFNATISSLNEGDVYYFIAEARNNAGTGSGSEQNFLTKPLEPTSFSATTASSSQINLSWTKGTGAEKTMVRGKEGSYPTSISDGYQVYFDTGTSTSDTSLSPSTTYYYRAWSEVTGSQQWSDNYASANAATTSGAPTVIGGLVLPINKATVLAPWLILFLILSLVITRIILNFRKGRSSSYS